MIIVEPADPRATGPRALLEASLEEAPAIKLSPPPRFALRAWHVLAGAPTAGTATTRSIRISGSIPSAFKSPPAFP